MNDAISGGALTNAHNTDNFVVADHTRSIPSQGECLESSDHTSNWGVESQNNSSWVSAAYSSTKVVIDVVKESSDVFPPLKSVASSLATVLKHYDVRSLSFVSSAILTTALASDNQSENSSIAGTPGGKACGITL